MPMAVSKTSRTLKGRSSSSSLPASILETSRMSLTCGKPQRRPPIRGGLAGGERRAQEAAGGLGRRSPEAVGGSEGCEKARRGPGGQVLRGAQRARV
eukprot:5099174-Prymnesium_polylepis.2